MRILVRKTQPIIICQARESEGMRLPKVCKQELSRGRAILLSLFEDNLHRSIKMSAERRNDMVAALADEGYIVYALIQ